ncbi:Transglycosylase SLT domain-containing protein [Tindallia magadiensis]|uniref:Transglycosylase SLT domain-containing protein n=1 Tax=Tindallia magadiensis TaxID=69895 RepID=A0A1I3AX30_9FIRM|nr:transglycosylase SLT domain-containing protein [Tindallia magadiensis]SFH54678.1 Transglycosylase SLT domain-containing protein [Tindallia magadiensis]
MNKSRKILIIWILLAAAILIMFFFLVPHQIWNEQKKAVDDISTLRKEAIMAHYRVSNPLERRHDDYLGNIYHKGFHREHLLSAEEQYLLDFLVSETGMSNEDIWILMRNCFDKDIPIWIVIGLIHVETGGTFEKELVGQHQDRGFMQITPITEKHLFELYHDEWYFTYDPEKIFENWYNIPLGLMYLKHNAERSQKDYGDVDWHKVLSEYNMGPTGLSRVYEWHRSYKTTYSKRVLEKKEEWMEKYEAIIMQTNEF